MGGEVGWGILGTAHIAESSFLPGLREAGGGRPLAVASRRRDAAEAFAAAHGVERAVEGYDALLADPSIEAVYVPLPNSAHRTWADAALRAGKAVFCEKPLCGTVEDTEALLQTARETGGLLWEAFVFPFHQQMERVQRLLADGAIGELREIQSSFHFLLENPANIRMSAELQGGSLQDVGCYPIRLARFLFGDEPTGGSATAVFGGTGVDEEMVGRLTFPGDRWLLFSCGFRRAYDCFTRLQGTGGQIHMTNPCHPGIGDTIEVVVDDERASRPAAVDDHSFTAALRHVNAAIRGDEPPRHLAVDEALGNAAAIELLLASARAGGQETGSPGA